MIRNGLHKTIDFIGDSLLAAYAVIATAIPSIGRGTANAGIAVYGGVKASFKAGSTKWAETRSVPSWDSLSSERRQDDTVELTPIGEFFTPAAA